jgi:hypothetical protein
VSEELCDLQKSPSTVRIVKCRNLRWTCACGGDGEARDAYNSVQNFSRASLRKRPLGRPRKRWEENIKMDLK